MDHHVVPLKVYIGVFVALMVLLVLTIAAAFIDLGPFSVPIALTIATAKAVLILLFFMHLRYSNYVSWVYAAAGFFWLLILLVFTLSDYLSRAPLAIPPG